MWRRLRGSVGNLVVRANERANEGAPGLARLLRVPAIGRRAAVLGAKVIALLVLANAFAGLFVVTYLTLTDDPTDVGWPVTIARNAGLFVGLILFFSLAAILRGRKVFAPSWSWLDHDGGPTPEERRQLLDQPVRLGFFPFKYWVAAAAVSLVGGGLLGAEADRQIGVVLTILFGGLVACAVGYLAGERVLRPAFAEALQGEPPETQRTLGIGSRLMLAWVLGSGIPFLGVALTPLTADDLELPLWVPMAFLSVTGLLSGLLLTVAVSASIIGPVGRVRGALQEVAAGNLDVGVVVDDGGQLGQLQAGVNELVSALRERRHLEELFGRHVGPEVARQAIERGVELGGEVRTISALFVDLNRSTELARTRPAQEVVALLNRFFEAVVRASDDHGGWVDKFEGDAALCVFGALGDEENAATRCLRTARALSDTLAALRDDSPELDAGIGVACGDAVAGHVGTESRLEYTVIGPPVNTAARLVVAAKERPRRVLADAGILEAAAEEERACWRPAGTVDLKGLPADLPVWEPA